MILTFAGAAVGGGGTAVGGTAVGGFGAAVGLTTAVGCGFGAAVGLTAAVGFGAVLAVALATGARVGGAVGWSADRLVGCRIIGTLVGSSVAVGGGALVGRSVGVGRSPVGSAVGTDVDAGAVLVAMPATCVVGRSPPGSAVRFNSVCSPTNR